MQATTGHQRPEWPSGLEPYPLPAILPSEPGAGRISGTLQHLFFFLPWVRTHPTSTCKPRQARYACKPPGSRWIPAVLRVPSHRLSLSWLGTGKAVGGMEGGRRRRWAKAVSPVPVPVPVPSQQQTREASSMCVPRSAAIGSQSVLGIGDWGLGISSTVHLPHGWCLGWPVTAWAGRLAMHTALLFERADGVGPVAAPCLLLTRDPGPTTSASWRPQLQPKGIGLSSSWQRDRTDQNICHPRPVLVLLGRGGWEHIHHVGAG